MSRTVRSVVAGSAVNPGRVVDSGGAVNSGRDVDAGRAVSTGRPVGVIRGVRPVVLAMAVVLAVVAAACGSDSDDGSAEAPADAASPFGVAPAADADIADSGPLPVFDRATPDTARGMPAPELSGQSLSGEPLTIGDDGRAKVILFVAHWCPHCQAEVPRVVGHLAENPLPDDVDLYGVATSSNPNAPNYPPADWLAEEQWTFPTLDDADNSAAAQYGLSGFPFFVGIDAEGKVVARGSGELTTDQFDQLVEAARSGSL